ncbi:hypothetical protein ABIA09_006874 [Bradyrhizobium yuanmingense]
MRADAGRHDVLERLVVDDGIFELQRPGDRHVLDQDLLHLGIKLQSLGLVERDGGLVEKPVDLRVGIAFGVREQDAFLDVRRHVSAGDAERGIAELVEQVLGHLIVPVADLLGPAGHIGADEDEIDADAGKALAEELAGALIGFAVRRHDVFDLSALAVGVGLQPHLVEQRLGLVDRIVVALDLAVVEFRLGRDRAGRDLGAAEIDPLGERVAVDQVHHRLPEALVVHRRDTVVHLEPLVRREILIALGGDFEVLLRLEALHVEELDVGPLRELHRAVLQRQRARCRIRDDAVDDLIQVRLVLQIVSFMAHQMDMRAAHPFLQLEWAGADRLVVQRVLAVVGAFIDVLWHDRRRGAVKAAEERRKGLLQLEHDGERIGRLGRSDARKILPRARMRLGQHLHTAEHDVLGRHRLAIVEGDVGKQLERIGQAIRRNLPGLRHARHRLEVSAIFEKTLVDLAAERQRRLLLVEGGDQQRRLGLNDRVECSTAGLAGRSRDAEGDSGAGGQHGLGEFASVHRALRVAYRREKDVARRRSALTNLAGASIVAKRPVPRYLIGDKNHRDRAISGPEDA